MKLMFVQGFQILLRDFKDVTTQPPHHPVGREQVVTLDAILVRGKVDPDHKVPPPKNRQHANCRQESRLARWGERHDLFSSGPTTSRHGLPTPGRASASARRLASFVSCPGASSSGATCSGKLFQICSISSSRSPTLSRSMPKASTLTG